MKGALQIGGMATPCLVLALAVGDAAAQNRTAGGAPLDVAGLEVAGEQDHRTTAGRTVGGVLHVSLEAREAAWYPWGPDRQGLRAHVFAEVGRPASVPAPMIRVSAGTPVRVTLRNTFPDTLLVRGLNDRGGRGGPGGALAGLIGDSVVVPPGGTAEVSFAPTVPGTYVYFGRVLVDGWSAGPVPGLPAEGTDRALSGVLVVDPPGSEPPPEERIFLITHWADPRVPGSAVPASRFMINGRSWPHTERLVYDEGEEVRWRVVNLTGREHPMHLHGFVRACSGTIPVTASCCRRGPRHPQRIQYASREARSC